MREKNYELSTVTQNSLEIAQANYETVITEILPTELTGSKKEIISELNLNPRRMYMRARMELEDNPELTTIELQNLLIGDLLKNTNSRLLRIFLKHTIKKILKEKKIWAQD